MKVSPQFKQKLLRMKLKIPNSMQDAPYPMETVKFIKNVKIEIQKLWFIFWEQSLGYG